MIYNFKMIGVFVGAVEVDDKKAGKGFVLVNQRKFVTASVEADSAEEGLKKLYENSDNAEVITVGEAVDDNLEIAIGAEKFASKEQIELVRSRLDKIEVPSYMELCKHSLSADVINTLMN